MFKKLFVLGLALIGVNTVATLIKDMAVIDYTIEEGQKASKKVMDGMFSEKPPSIDEHFATTPRD